MAFQRNFSQELKTVTEAEKANGSFDCNICLDFAHEPVVTLCGHLYCWPCIYKWFQVQSDSLAYDENPQCPICKVEISLSTMIPLYGRGQTSASGKPTCCDVPIPPRPPASGAQALLATSSQSDEQLPSHNPYQGLEDATSQMLNLGASLTPRSHHPVIGMFVEVVFGPFFGNSDNLYTSPNSYQLMGSNSSGLRGQEMGADQCLNRISFFLFCFFLLCLIVF